MKLINSEQADSDIPKTRGLVNCFALRWEPHQNLVKKSP